MRQGQHDLTGGQDFAIDEPHASHPIILHLQGDGAGAKPQRRASRQQVARGGVAKQIAQANSGVANARAARVMQQALLKDHQRQPRAGALAIFVERGQRNQVPEVGDSIVAFATRSQPVGKAEMIVSAAPAPARLRNGRQGARRPQFFAPGKHRQAQKRRQQMQRRGHGQARTLQHGVPLPGGEDGHMQARLQARGFVDAQALQEAQIGRAAAQKDMLAVIDGHAGLLVAEGPRFAAEDGARFHQRHRQTRVGQVAGGGDACQAAAHHYNVGESPRHDATASLVNPQNQSQAVNWVFSRVERLIRLLYTS